MVEEVYIEKRVLQDTSEAPPRPLTRGLIDLFALKEYILRVLDEAGVNAAGQAICLVDEVFPSSLQVAQGTVNTTLELDADVAFITINGVLLRPQEFTRNGLDLSITPLNGFFDTNDVISIFQNKADTNGNSILNATFVSNSYESIGSPQIFNPTATQVTGGTGIFTLSSGSDVVLVAINGQVIPNGEYALVGNQLTVTPSNNFADITDVVAVYQSTPSVNSQGGLRLSYREINADYQVALNDYLIETKTDLITVDLYDATNNVGNIIEIKNSSTGVIIIRTQNSQLIDESIALSLAPLVSVKLASNGQKWIILNRYG